MSERSKEADAPGKEIEVTPEMIEAGGRILLRENSDSWDEIVVKIYRAMEGERRS